MLRGIHKASSNWLGRAVMGAVMALLAGSFAIWGIGDIFHGYSSTSLAKIGNAKIQVDQFQQAYNNRLQQISQQLGHPVTPEQASALGLDRQVLSQLVIDAGIDQLAQRMRLGVPNAAIAQRIVSNPNFQTPTGQFDRARFDAFLQEIGYSEQGFIDLERRQIPRREIVNTISDGVAAPAALLKAVNQFQNQERSIQYVEIGPQQAGTIPPPTTDELNKYYSSRKILFRAPEYRKVATVTVVPATLAKSIKVSDAEVKKYYEENLSNYVTPERRHIEQIVFPTMDEAQAGSARIKSGTSFSALAAARGLKPSDIDLGTVKKSDIIDPAVADAAFSLKQGEVSGPIKGRFGADLVKVLSIEPKQTEPLSAAAPSIRNEIALNRAKTQVENVHDKIEDARAGGSTLEQAARKLNLPIVTVDVDRSGRNPAGKLVKDLADASGVVSAAFASDIGVDNDPIQAENGYIWYDVVSISPARDRTLNEVKTEVERRWRNNQIAKRLKAKADDMLGKLKSGATFAALAKADGLNLQTVAGLMRGKVSAGLSPRVTNAAFHVAKNGFGATPGSQPTQWVVFRVTDVKTPAFDPKSAAGKKLENLLQQSIGEDLFTQYAAWLENDLGTHINQSLLSQTVGGGAPATD